MTTPSQMIALAKAKWPGLSIVSINRRKGTVSAFFPTEHPSVRVADTRKLQG